MFNQKSEQKPDSDSFLAELLLATLRTAKAGLFYSPISTPSTDPLPTGDSPLASDQAWSLNIGPLFGIAESPKDAAELLPFVVESDRHILIACVVASLDGEIHERECEYRICLPSGEIRWLRSHMFIGLGDADSTRYLASLCIDITDQKRSHEKLEKTNEALHQAQEYFRTALSTSGIAIFRHAIDINEVSAKKGFTWNFNLAQIFGYRPETVMTLEYQFQRMKQVDIEAIRTKSLAALKDGTYEFQHEYPIKWDDQSTHWLLSKCFVEVDGSGRPEYVSGAVINISDRKLAEEKIQFIATHDALTELPNRFMFSELLNHTIDTAKRYSNHFALLFIDLDRFKSINDALGHQEGDKLLIAIAKRLRRCLRSSDILARISGDEFILLAPLLDSEETASAIARKIISEVSQPMVLRGQKCQVTASVGICLYPDHGEDEQTLIKNADCAMYMAKEAGKNNYQFFNSSSTSKSLERMAIESELRSALLNNELSLNYQAKLDLRTNEITGVEALLRWNNPKYGNVSPAEFIPIAEETGLIVPIGHWVLMTACKQGAEWKEQGIPPICIAVNLSARQFKCKDLLNHIKEALNESGMAPELLELEITESMVMHQVDQAVALLYEIKELGVRIAIDDFGTGYSSLAQLKRFPIDTLKVDSSFIREVAHDADDQAITDAVIALGKSLSLTIVAEGVETQDQQNFLRDHSCDEMQGYYFSRPVPALEFSALFREHLEQAKT